MLVIRDLNELAAAARARGRLTGLGGVLVPTMGALHEGHAALIRRGAALARERVPGSGCAVSIFVNPTQFNDRADFERYPKSLEADLAVCHAAGATAVFAPDVESMYPSRGTVGGGGADGAPVPALPPVATEPGLEDRFRPGHFAGVCQVVLRLFRLLEPALAVFGEKDWQQLQVVTALASAAAPDVRIVAHPTLRDPDGLAMSSRNRFLSPPERLAALGIPRSLHAAGRIADPVEAEREMHAALRESKLETEYAVVRDAASLGPVIAGRPGRALIAARAGRTRLIDNAPWPWP